MKTFCVNLVSSNAQDCQSCFVFAEDLRKALPKAYALAQHCAIAYDDNSWSVESVELVKAVA